MFGTHFNTMGSVKFVKFTINLLTLPFNFNDRNNRGTETKQI